jgi:hypothetical protein
MSVGAAAAVWRRTSEPSRHTAGSGTQQPLDVEGPSLDRNP